MVFRAPALQSLLTYKHSVDLALAVALFPGKLLESPVWDGRLERLIFVDTDGQKIHTYDPLAPSRYLQPEILMSTSCKQLKV